MRQSKLLMAVVIAAVFVILAFLGRDLYLRKSETIPCEDGSHRTIDIRSFTNDYWAYSAEFEAALSAKVKFSAKLDPKQLQQLSDATQQAVEFRKFVVAGYNSCAIAKKQYSEFGRRFQVLDSLSKQIAALGDKGTLTSEEKRAFSKLVEEYVSVSRRLAQ
jgi:hypothetical protein